MRHRNRIFLPLIFLPLIFLPAALHAGVLSAQAAQVQTSSSAALPATHATTLAGTSITLPVLGHPMLLLVGFSRQSGAAADAGWKQAQPFCAAHPEVACYEVAMLEDAPAFIRGMIVHGMRSGQPQSKHNQFVTVVEQEAAWKQALQVENTDNATAVLLDAAGKIVWQTSGDATTLRLDEKSLNGSLATPSTTH